MTPIVFSMLEVAGEKYPDMGSGCAIGGVTLEGPVQTFVWTVEVTSGRLPWIRAAIGLVRLAALLFNRFDPSTERWRLKKVTRETTEEQDEVVSVPAPAGSPIQLTSLEIGRGNLLSVFARTVFRQVFAHQLTNDFVIF